MKKNLSAMNRGGSMLKDKRIRVITGHYGSGKTEFAVNYALRLAEADKKVAIADLDVVNAYFRSREKKELFEEKGVRVISSSVEAPAIDVPAIAADVHAPLQDESYDFIMDIGGDPIGARVLGSYRRYFIEGNYDMFCVINANRPETSTVEKTIEYLKNIEIIARAKVTGLINNTHLLRETTVDEVLKGQTLVKAVSKELDIPIKYVSTLRNVAEELPENIEGEVFPIDLIMREDWMDIK